MCLRWILLSVCVVWLATPWQNVANCPFQQLMPQNRTQLYKCSSVSKNSLHSDAKRPDSRSTTKDPPTPPTTLTANVVSTNAAQIRPAKCWFMLSDQSTWSTGHRVATIGAVSRIILRSLALRSLGSLAQLPTAQLPTALNLYLYLTDKWKNAR